MVDGEAELEAVYRLLGNDAVTPEAVLAPHLESTAKRARQAGTVLVIHDTTAFHFGGTQRREGLGTNNGKGQGFMGHFSLAVLPGEARLPLGVCALERVNRQVMKNSNQRTSKISAKDPKRESLRWQRAVEEVEVRMEGVECIHVMDREGDTYDLLAMMLRLGAQFVVRASYNRALEGENRLFGHVSKLKPQASREVELNRRSHHGRKECSSKRHPERRARRTKLSIAGSAVELKRSATGSAEERTLTLNVVRVWEQAPTKGEPPVSWLLYTTEPIETKNQLLHIVMCIAPVG